MLITKTYRKDEPYFYFPCLGVHLQSGKVCLMNSFTDVITFNTDGSFDHIKSEKTCFVPYDGKIIIESIENEYEDEQLGNLTI